MNSASQRLSDAKIETCISSQFRSTILAALFLFASGCSTFRPKDYSKEKTGEWSGKVLIRDKRQSKSGIVNMKVRAVDQEKLRIDVTSPLGSHLASVLVNGGDVSFLNVEDKALYTGVSGQEELARFLKVPLEPSEFFNLLFDRPFANKNWVCSRDSNGLLKLCEDKKSGLSVNWVMREGIKRTVAVENSYATVQMNLYSFSNEIAEPEKAFTIKAPAAFKNKK